MKNFICTHVCVTAYCIISWYNVYIMKNQSNNKCEFTQKPNSVFVCFYSSINRIAKNRNRKNRSLYKDALVYRTMKLHAILA